MWKKTCFKICPSLNCPHFSCHQVPNFHSCPNFLGASLISSKIFRLLAVFSINQVQNHSKFMQFFISHQCRCLTTQPNFPVAHQITLTQLARLTLTFIAFITPPIFILIIFCTRLSLTKKISHSGSGPSLSVTSPPPPAITTDPDDIIYNDDKPVTEDYDPVMPDAYSNLKPGQYLVASNPVVGTFVAEVTDYHPKNVVKKLHKSFNEILSNFVDVFF